MPKPRAKSKPRKKTAVKKKATRTTKLHRGGELPSNPNVIDQYRPGGYGGPRPGERIPGPREFPGTRTAEGFEPYVPGGGSSYTPYDSPGGQFRTPPSPWQQGPTPPAYGAPQGRGAGQRELEASYQAARLGGRYGRPGSPGGWGPERPTGGATYGAGRGAGQAELNAQYQGRLGTGIGGQAPWRQLEQPPRRPPPPIRPGYQRGGMTPSDPTRNPNQRGAINQQVRAGRRERGRGLGGYGGPSLPPGRNRPQDFPNPRQIPHQGPGPARQPAIDPARMADLNRLLGGGVGRRPTPPPRRPPPKIRPGY